MDTKQPQLLGISDAAEKSGNPASVGFIADTRNNGIEAPLKSHLRRAIASDPTANIIIPETEQLNRDHKVDQLNCGHKVVVALLGVPSASNYEQVIGQFLTTWSNHPNPKRPAVLIATSDPRATQKAVDNWQGWELAAKRLQQPVEELKRAIIVNDEYLVSQGGEKALAQIKNSVTVAESLKSILAPIQPATPSGMLRKPSIEGMPELETLRKF